MKIKQFICLISILFAFNYLSAQKSPRLLGLEVSGGLAFNHRNLAATAGLHLSIGSHINAGLFFSTDPIGYQEIKPNYLLTGAKFSSANINHQPAYGVEFKYYQHKNQRGIFIGSGIYRGSYKVDAYSFTEKENRFRSNIGGNIFGPSPDILTKYHRTITQHTHLGITSEVGYLFPLKNGRLEASLRVFNPLYLGDKFEVYQEDSGNSTRKISVKDDFKTIAINVELKYVRIL